MTASAPDRSQHERFIRDVLGLSMGEFLSGVQERRMHGPHKTAERLDAARVVMMADMDYLLNHSGVPPSDFHITKGGAIKDDRRVIDELGRTNSAYVYERFLKGATIRLVGAHRHLPRVAGFANRLAAALVTHVSANIYLTPDGGTGLAPHYDGHDVVVLQCVGSKRWRIYADFSPPVLLPTNEAQRHTQGRHEPGRVEREVRLSAGDVLYLPRGLMHEAHPEGGHSLHVTFALNTLTAGELVMHALKLAMEEDVRLRRAIPHEARLHPEAFDDSFLTSLVAEVLTAGGRVQRALQDYRRAQEDRKFRGGGYWFAAHEAGLDGMGHLEGVITERVREFRRAANRPDAANRTP